jgi:23S rRNA pseudouridine1911/1915/1917 synthase
MPQTLLDWLAAHFSKAKKQTLKRMVEAGRVRVNGKPARKLAQPLEATDGVTVDERPASARRAPHRSGELEIMYEDADLLVVNKPAGLLTSTVEYERRPTLLARVKEHVEAPGRRNRVGLIHRLDRDASGLLVFSKNDAAYRSLKTQFFHHDVERVYTAVVRGVPHPPQAKIESHLLERADGTVYSTPEHGKGQRAATSYETVRVADDRKASLLKVTLHTGRKHQIRVHLSEKGNPIIGDRVYGGAVPGERLLLAATRLVVNHPRTGKRLTFEVDATKEFAMDRVRAGADASGEARQSAPAVASPARRDVASDRPARTSRRSRKQK